MSLLKSAVIFLLVLAVGFDCHAQTTLPTSRFGDIRVSGDKNQASGFVMFLSDDTGWDPNADEIVKVMVGRGLLVAGIDTKVYLEQLSEDDEECHYLAGEFERLAQVVQQNIGMKRFFRPLLAGYRAGAALTYVVMAEGPQGIDGGLSVDFCPSVRIDRSICEEDQNFSEPRNEQGVVGLNPIKNLEKPWFVLTGMQGGKCASEAVETFARGMGKAQVFRSPPASGSNSWSSALRPVLELFAKLVSGPRTVSDVSTEDLPLVPIPAERKERDYFAIFISGDGGWASIDKEVGESLSDHGVSVVGVDALRYFWSRREPAAAGRDLERILNDYTQDWGKKRVALIGYSLGADVLPVMFNNLSKAAQDKVFKLVLLNPAQKADLKVHLTDWVGLEIGEEGIPLMPELKKIDPNKLYCLYGMDDDETICRSLPAGMGKTQGLGGSHHFDGDYQKVAELILSELK